MKKYILNLLVQLDNQLKSLFNWLIESSGIQTTIQSVQQRAYCPCFLKIFLHAFLSTCFFLNTFSTLTGMNFIDTVAQVSFFIILYE